MKFKNEKMKNYKLIYNRPQVLGNKMTQSNSK